jgi:hypothetical protein
MALSEHSGYSSSLDHSTDLKIYHGALNLNLLSPERPSREPPHADIRPLKLETVLSENREAMKTPDHGHDSINLTEPQPHQEVKGSSLSGELIFSSQRVQEPEKQNSKNSWWKSWTKRPKRRTTRGSSKPKIVTEHDQPEDESYDPSDTSASQSFRKEPQDIVKELLLRPEDNVTTTDNGHSILTCGRSKSCRQDSHSKKVVSKGGLSQSMRLEPSASLLKTIHEKQGLDRPQHWGMYVVALSRVCTCYLYPSGIVSKTIPNRLFIHLGLWANVDPLLFYHKHWNLYCSTVQSDSYLSRRSFSWW